VTESNVLLHWVLTFAFTQAIEIPIYQRPLRAYAPWPRVFIAFAATLLTHPVVWFGIPGLITLVLPDGVVSEGTRYVVYFAVAELFAWLAEAAYLRLFQVRRALLWSLAANVASASATMLAQKLTGWP
jgi:hypothetical protein